MRMACIAPEDLLREQPCIGLAEGDAGETQAAALGQGTGDAGGGGGVVQAFGADIGDAVALGVGAARSRGPGDVGTEGVGRAEAGTFADEDDGCVGVEGLADLVGESYAGLLGDDDGCEAPGGIRFSNFEEWEKGVDYW